LAHRFGATAFTLVAVFTISGCDRTRREDCNGWQHTCHNFAEHEGLHNSGEIKRLDLEKMVRLPNEEIPDDRLQQG
jgi:hypothetical protein